MKEHFWSHGLHGTTQLQLTILQLVYSQISGMCQLEDVAPDPFLDELEHAEKNISDTALAHVCMVYK